jgi:para-nitrobenzyl esterase
MGDPVVAESVSVSTSKGDVKGFRTVAGGPASFRGVPYAASTADGNRWRAPQPCPSWGEAKDCTKYGDACFQAEQAMGKLLGGAPAGGDIGKVGDGVLNLNLVTPDPSGKFPVMCFIHGGSNKMSSNKGDSTGSSPTFDDTWAERGVVVVALNYRLALHGFMHIPEDGVTNLALRDLIAGLTWIKDEIAAFGGDPNNVTVWGQSAGAINICSLLCAPKAKGLFSKAIIQSGGLSLLSVADYNNIVYKDYKKCVTPLLKVLCLIQFCTILFLTIRTIRSSSDLPLKFACRARSGASTLSLRFRPSKYSTHRRTSATVSCKRKEW